MFVTLAKGFVIGAGLIMPIGAQNAYVLNQGIKRNNFCDFIVGIYFINLGATLKLNIHALGLQPHFAHLKKIE